MADNTYEFGMVGLGTMGRSLLLNIADHGVAVAGLDTDSAKSATLKSEGEGKRVEGTTDAKAFVAMLRNPRAIMMLVPAGAPVDAVIAQISPLLDKGDILIDGGNSYFKDTDRRGKELSDKGLEFLGLGVSGGESGARHGPSMMAGGTPEAYEHVRKTLEAVAAKHGNEPCVALMGPGSAGHYVKMVHNGIEYGVMQLIAETYDAMRRGLGMSNEFCRSTFNKWNSGILQSFLIEITATVLGKKEDGQDLVDLISDKAKQKGTGKWASQDAMDLGVPIPTIDAAVAARVLSSLKDERVVAYKRFPPRPKDSSSELQAGSIDNLESALMSAILLTYAQGFAQLRAASEEYGYSLNLETVAKVWRAGCIIRSLSLERIRTAFSEPEPPVNLLLDREYGNLVMSGYPALRSFIGFATRREVPIPCFSASLAYFDSYRSPLLPANLIQAQRDYFGAHGYERIDKTGTFHTEWGSD
jgi:6-phosphogluconate dehydrogenase